MQHGLFLLSFLKGRNKMSDLQRTTSWHSQKPEAIYETLKTGPRGLSDAEAEKRLRENGANELQKQAKRGLLAMIWEQLKDPMILILIAASVLSFVLNEVLEGGVIIIIVAINAIISIVQEKKAEASLEALREMTAAQAIAIRQGEERIVHASDLVVGDVVLIEDGSMVPADIRLIESASLKIQEASLTGESVPSEKDANAQLDEECVLGDRATMAYSSTFATYGRGKGVVVATGMNTEVGNIAALLHSQEEMETPIKRKLASVGKVLTVAGIIICVFVFILGLIYRQPILPLFMTAISLAVSVIPEGLPATATIVLALGVQRMAKRGAIIRKLPAVETLGSATVICTDKTGTLTLNKMTVKQIVTAEEFSQNKPIAVEEALKNKESYTQLILAGDLCNNSEFDPDHPGNILGDPTEGALIMLSDLFDKKHADLKKQYPRVFEQPFDSDRKRMTTVHQMDGEFIAYTKGAIDEMMPVCTKILVDGQEKEITKEDKERFRKISDAMAGNALRVLAFAKKTLKTIPENNEDVEFDLTIIGLVGMIDPPREEVKVAVKTCYEAGIRTVMITGDHKITAMAIAKELGIWREGDTVYNGSELNGLSDQELEKIVMTTSVYARVSPEQKLKIVQALQRNGEVAAMTGDGVNDAPALKTADIGTAMGITGTDVAKESADMVLTDDNFATIVDAVEGGRRVYRNIQKVIQFLLAGNISEVLTIVIAAIFNFPAPLLAIHILWVNLVTDTLPALGLGVDPAEKDIMKKKPIRSNSLFEKDLIWRVIVQGCFIAAVSLGAFFIGYREDLASGQGMAFCTIAFSQLIYSYTQRSNTQFSFTKGFFENKYLHLTVLLSAGMMGVLAIVPAIRKSFCLSALSGSEWGMIVVLAIIPTILTELIKVFLYIKRKMSK